jgi:predicted AAA+ superfamily ATPase
MLAHYHGQVWNASELSRALGADQKTAKHYLDILQATFVVRTLQPYSANVRKRQVKSPKVYLTDSGLLHALLDIPDQRRLESHPKVGASWEGFIIEQICLQLGVRPGDAFFWGTHSGPELDLLVKRRGRLYGFEIKRTTTPRVTDSMRQAKDLLGLADLSLVHAGKTTFSLGAGIRAIAASRILEDL